MTNETALLKIPLRVAQATVPFRTLPVPIEIQNYFNEKTLSKSFWNQCAFGPNQLGVVQCMYRKQAATLHKSSVNDPAVIQWVTEQLPLSGNPSVLDINTGTGVVARAAASKGAKVTATDVSRHMLSFAASIPSKVNYVRAKSQQLPLESNSFDIVVSRLAFNHIVERDQVLKEMVRVCKPDGYIALIERIFPEDQRFCEGFENRMNFMENVRDPSHVWFLSVAEMKTLLSSNNVQVSESTTTECTETLDSYLRQCGTLPPNMEYISQWVNGNITTDDPEHNQITGFKPFRKNETAMLTHTHAFVGGRLSKE